MSNACYDASLSTPLPMEKREESNSQVGCARLRRKNQLDPLLGAQFHTSVHDRGDPENLHTSNRWTCEDCSLRQWNVNPQDFLQTGCLNGKGTVEKLCLYLTTPPYWNSLACALKFRSCLCLTSRGAQDSKHSHPTLPLLKKLIV